MSVSDIYDVIIIGAGLSGLAAGIRLGHFGKKVLILEKHNAPGGLNSFYSLKGHKYDVGLHAMTNYPNPKASKTPLTRVLRQLRISFDDLAFIPQKRSRILFPEKELIFDNDIATLKASIATYFPHSIDAFEKFIEQLPNFDDAIKDSRRHTSGREYLKSFLFDETLIEMLLCVVCYYGSARPNDIDFAQLVILFRSIFLEGLGRPTEGIRPLIKALLNRYRETSGERRMKCAVKSLHYENDHIYNIELENGEILSSHYILSSIGAYETFQLLYPTTIPSIQPSELSFLETITYYPISLFPKMDGNTILFYNNKDSFQYEPPANLVDFNSGVICCTHDYQFSPTAQPEEACLKVTALANPHLWNQLSITEYQKSKNEIREKLLHKAQKYLLKTNMSFPQPIAEDSFTPKTIQRFTGHIYGSVYGCAQKFYDGITPINNLLLCGTDQGLLGIVGAMLSGVSQANLLLQRL